MTAIIAGAMIFAPGVAAAFTYEIELHNSNYIERGRALLKEGNIQAAIKQYEMGLKGGLGSSDLQDAHNDLCVAYYFLAEYETALDHCEEAIDLVPNHWVHYNNRANIYLMQGELKLAKKDYRKALKLHPKSEVIERNIALADRIERTRPSVSRPMSNGKEDKPDTKNFNPRPATTVPNTSK
jgi:tetratricopeptide (TPR) repeat protein